MTRRNRRNDESTAPRHNRQPRREPAISGPTPADISGALHTLLETGLKQTPKLSAIRTLTDAEIQFPVKVGDRRIIGASIKGGEPMNGAMRSDDHISYYEVEFGKECPEEDCYSEVTRYKYSAHGFEHGSEETFCPSCQTAHEVNRWG